MDFLLGHILSLRAGQIYEELFIQRIGDVLKLHDTRITLTPDMEARLAKGHHNGLEVENWDFSTLAGAGALRSTAHDILLFLAANMDLEETPLNAAMNTMHTPRFNGPSGLKIGLGWHILECDNKETIWHNGGTGGYRSFMGFLRGGDTGVVVLTNSSESVDDIGILLLHPTLLQEN